MAIIKGNWRMQHENNERGTSAAPPGAVSGQQHPPTRFLRGWWLALWVALLLGAFAVQAITSMLRKSGTYDECVDLAAGYSHLVADDYRMNPEHPPLAKMIAALPLLFIKVDGAFDSRSWEKCEQWDFGCDFLYSGRNDAATLLLWGRFSAVIISMCLGLLVFFWARRLFGNAAGLFALFLLAFCPNIIAHGSLATTDLPLAFFFLLSLFTFDIAARRLTFFAAGIAGFSLGLALLTKFSAPLLLPVMLLAAVFRIFDRTPLEFRLLKHAFANTWRMKAVALVALFCIMLATAYVVLWAGYRFRYSPCPDGNDRTSLLVQPAQNRLLKVIYANHLLPRAFVDGYRYLSQGVNRPSYLDGQHNWSYQTKKYTTWPHYFVMTTLYKTPVPMLVFFVVTLCATFWWSRKTWTRETLLIVGMLIYFGAASFSGMNIGHRHILPVIPMAFIFVSKIPGRLRLKRQVNSIMLKAGFGLLLAWYACGAVSIYPNYLAYFNEIAGGPANGPEHLTDSNIDWGQDLIMLRNYMDEHNIASVNLIYFGTANPRSYGVRCKFFMPPRHWPSSAMSQIQISDFSENSTVNQGDYFAVSVTLLEETCSESPFFSRILKMFREETPVARIGYSIYLYRSPVTMPGMTPREITDIMGPYWPGSPSE
jgi:hypothetical protein